MENKKILNGKLVNKKILKDLEAEISEIIRHGVMPHLSLIQVGADKASTIYLKHKKRVCEKIGVKSSIINLLADISQEELIKKIEELNNDDDINGILVQLPLPKELNTELILESILPTKDIDGLHPLNQGKNFLNSASFKPISCTPNGIMKLLDFYNIEVKSKNVVIVGRSQIVGKPLLSLMLNKNANIINLHTSTLKDDFKSYINNADILILAAGVEDIVTPDMVKKGVVIIDVGIHRDENNKIRGDVLHQDFMEKISFITPVPGGVGPITVAMLMYNLVKLTKRRLL